MSIQLFRTICREYNLGINEFYSIVEGHTKLSVMSLTKAENHMRNGDKLSKQFFGNDIELLSKIRSQVKSIVSGFQPKFSLFGSRYELVSKENSLLELKKLEDLFEGDISLNDYYRYDDAIIYKKKLL